MMWALWQGHAEIALAVAVLFACYLRPFELVNLRTCDLALGRSSAKGPISQTKITVGPSELGVPTKVGAFDDCISVSSAAFPWLTTAMEDLKASRKNEPMLWTFEMETLRRVFSAAVFALALPPDTCLYQLRHGGASHDLATSARSFEEVRSRGRWMTDSSVRRYSKVGILQRYVSTLPAAALEYGERAGPALEAAIYGSEDPMPLPGGTAPSRPAVPPPGPNRARNARILERQQRSQALVAGRALPLPASTTMMRRPAGAPSSTPCKRPATCPMKTMKKKVMKKGR